LKRRLSKTSDLLLIRDKIEYSMSCIRMKMSKSKKEGSYQRILRIRLETRTKWFLAKNSRTIPRDSLWIWQDNPIQLTLAPEPRL